MGQCVGRDEREGELSDERHQAGETVAPGQDGVLRTGIREAETGQKDDPGQGDRKHEGVGIEPFDQDCEGAYETVHGNSNRRAVECVMYR